jgi:hypothetical protein
MLQVAGLDNHDSEAQCREVRSHPHTHLHIPITDLGHVFVSCNLGGGGGCAGRSIHRLSRYCLVIVDTGKTFGNVRKSLYYRSDVWFLYKKFELYSYVLIMLQCDTTGSSMMRTALRIIGADDQPSIIDSKSLVDGR